jgi:hypothetical protein
MAASGRRLDGRFFSTRERSLDTAWGRFENYEGGFQLPYVCTVKSLRVFPRRWDRFVHTVGRYLALLG